MNLRSDYNLRLKNAVTTAQVPLTQSAMKVRPELDDVTLRYVQDLLAWVEDNQRRIDEAPWGSDLPSVESQLGSHRGLHQTVEDFRSKIERARADEVIPATESLGGDNLSQYYTDFEVNLRCTPHILQTQLSPLSKGTYREYLGKLDLQYGKLLVTTFIF